MKNIILSLLVSLCSLNVFAGSDQPIGFDKMLTTLSQVEDPQEAVGKTFLLSSPAGLENSVLHILPEDAAETLTVGKGNYRVRIVKAEPFYDMEYFNENGMVSLNKVDYSWTNGGVDGPHIIPGQSCMNILKFTIGSNELTQETLNRFKTSNTPYRFDYNHSVLQQSQDNELAFTRLTNDPTTVTLTLYKKDGSIYAKKESDPIATCNLLPKKQEQVQEIYQWSAWSNFGSCSATCGGGTQSRTRSCLTENSVACVGNAYEERSCNEQACEEVVPMTKKQQEQLMYHGVTISITSSSNLTVLNPKGFANYEASLSNPFSRAITCDISITSSRGVNSEFQTIDHKAHFGVNVPAGGMTKVSGAINIMRGHGDTGLGWTDPRWQGFGYKAENCRFSN